MDNQFRNVKTHARLLSKSMWYEWRMKLIEGLKEGLVRHVEEMNADDAMLSEKEHILDSVVPDLADKHASLKTEAQELHRRAEEMENCDQDELRHKREKLAAVEAQINKKKRLLEDWQEDLQDKNKLIEEGTELKTNYLHQINEAERVMEECRGWSVNEVNELKGMSKPILLVFPMLSGHKVEVTIANFCASSFRPESRASNRMVYRVGNTEPRFSSRPSFNHELP